MYTIDQYNIGESICCERMLWNELEALTIDELIDCFINHVLSEKDPPYIYLTTRNIELKWYSRTQERIWFKRKFQLPYSDYVQNGYQTTKYWLWYGMFKIESIDLHEILRAMCCYGTDSSLIISNHPLILSSDFIDDMYRRTPKNEIYGYVQEALFRYISNHRCRAIISEMYYGEDALVLLSPK